MEGQHGFARRVMWALKSAIENNNTLTIEMQLCHSEETLKMWNHEFTLNYTIIIQATEAALRTKLEIVNTGKSSFSCHALLHTYFAIEEATKVNLFGQFTGYLDKVTGKMVENEPNLLVQIDSEIDRIYSNVEGPFRIIEKVNGEVEFEFLIETTFNDLVVWNPWVEKSKGMTDFEDDDYKKMICVEVGNVANEVVLKAGESWTREQKITTMKTNTFE